MSTAYITSLLENTERHGDQGFVDELLGEIRKSGIPASEATRRIDLALSTFRELWDAQESANRAVLANLAKSYARLGGLKQAVDLYMEVISLAESIADRSREADGYRKLGRVKRRQTGGRKLFRIPKQRATYSRR